MRGSTPGGLRLVGPFRGLLELRYRHPGDPAALVQRQLVRRDGGVEAGRVLGDEVAVDPALVDDVGEEAVEEGDVGPGLDVEVQHAVLRHLLGDRDRCSCAAGSTKMNRARGQRLIGEQLLALVGGAALQVRNPVRQEIVGLGLVLVRADAHDAVGELRVLVGVVELAHAHVARGVALRVVGRPVVDAHHRRLQRGEHQLARAPGVLEAARRRRRGRSS